MASAEIFVRLNGMRLDATNAELEELTLGVADERLSKDEVTAFFNSHVVAGETPSSKRTPPASATK
ncbi:MAG: hypothetical protein KAV82_07340 [Phycisphaerae bacterium]|nr:hypothetical protein [Phycisphaerae bacterium]